MLLNLSRPLRADRCHELFLPVALASAQEKPSPRVGCAQREAAAATRKALEELRMVLLEYAERLTRPFDHCAVTAPVWE